MRIKARGSDPNWRTSDNGRFDVFRSRHGWSAIDWNIGRRFNHPDISVCMAWCVAQALL